MIFFAKISAFDVIFEKVESNQPMFKIAFGNRFKRQKSIFYNCFWKNLIKDLKKKELYAMKHPLSIHAYFHQTIKNHGKRNAPLGNIHSQPTRT